MVIDDNKCHIYSGYSMYDNSYLIRGVLNFFLYVYMKKLIGIDLNKFQKTSKKAKRISQVKIQQIYNITKQQMLWQIDKFPPKRIQNVKQNDQSNVISTTQQLKTIWIS